MTYGRFRVWWAFTSVFAYAVVLGYTIAPSGLETVYNFGGSPLPILASYQQLEGALGMADAGMYLRGGRQVAETGWAKPGYIPFWPPGMFFVYALAILLVTAEGPILGVVAAITLVFWTAVLSLLFVILRRALHPLAAFLLPFALLLPPLMRGFMLDSGMVFSESISTATWCLSLIFVYMACAQRSVSWAALGGVFLALAAYFRAQFQVMVDLSTLLMIFLAAVIGIWNVCARRTILSVKSIPDFKYIFLSIVVFHALAAPYRIYVHRTYPYAWAAVDWYYKYVWMLPEQYSPVAGFILQGGGPAGCVTDRERCLAMAAEKERLGKDYIEPNYRNETVKGMLRHPFKWIGYRMEHFPPYWFTNNGYITPGPPAYLYGSILLFLLTSVPLLALLAPAGPEKYFILFQFLVVVSANIGTFMFIHYEVRYFSNLQVATVGLSLLSLPGFWSSVNQINSGLEKSLPAVLRTFR